MPAGWQRSNGELVSLLQFLLFISSLSIFCLVNLVKAEFETRIFFFFWWRLCHYFWSWMAWGRVYSLKKNRSGILGTESLLRSFVVGCSDLHRVTPCPQSFLFLFKSMNPSKFLPSSHCWGGSAPFKGWGELLKSGVQKIAAHFSCDKSTIQCSSPLYPPNNNPQKNTFPPGKGRKISHPAEG